VDKDNRPIVLDFNISTPFRTSGNHVRPLDTQPTASEIAAAPKPVTGRALPRAARPGDKVAKQ